MALLEDLSTELANAALDKAEEFGDEKIVEKVAQAIGSSSPTLEENYRTAIRLIRAARRARATLASATATEPEDDAPKTAPADPASIAEPENPDIADAGEAVMDVEVQPEVLQLPDARG